MPTVRFKRATLELSRGSHEAASERRGPNPRTGYVPRTAG